MAAVMSTSHSVLSRARRSRVAGDVGRDYDYCRARATMVTALSTALQDEFRSRIASAPTSNEWRHHRCRHLFLCSESTIYVRFLIINVDIYLFLQLYGYCHPHKSHLSAMRSSPHHPSSAMRSLSINLSMYYN